MRSLLIIAILALTGCASNPTVMDWPTVPAELKKPAPELTPLAKDKRKQSDLIQNANENYSKYYELKNRYEAWQKWEDEQSKIYTGVIKKTQNN